MGRNAVPREFACRGRDQVLELVDSDDSVVICERVEHPERFEAIPGDGCTSG